MPSFQIIGLLVLKKKNFKVLTIYGHGGHLGHVTRTIHINFRSLFPGRFHIKVGFDWPRVPEEKTFEIVDGRRRRRRQTTDNRNPTTKNLGLIGHAVSKKKMFENNGYVHVYSPGAGANNPWGQIYFITSIIQ